MDAFSKLKKQHIAVTYVTADEARAIRFPVGHPRKQVVYAGHPVVPDLYFPVSQFHRRTFEHKVSEAMQVLMSLGAREIEVLHVQGWSSEMMAKLSIPLDQPGSSVGARGGLKSGSSANMLFKASLSGAVTPSLPPGLVWFPHEPAWNQVAEGRLRYGMKSFSLSVLYQDDFGVTAGVAAAIAGTTLEIGGSFEKHEMTLWRMEGQFG
jgi:hypothetical protein